MPTVRFDRKPDAESAAWYRDPTGQFTAGFWSHEGGAIEVDYTEHEFCVLLAGRVRITERGGHTEEYGMGDGFVIPAGFKGVWETLKPVRKWYVTFEAKEG
jgi:uncharacterized protein